MPVGLEVNHPDIALLDRLRPIKEQAEAWKMNRSTTLLMSRAEIFNCLEPARGKWLVLSIGHDDYTTIPGGVQVCLQREESLTREAGGRYLNLHPLQPLPCLADAESDPDPRVVLVFDGTTLGACRMSDLIDAAGDMVAADTQLSLAIHHLMGHSTEQIAKLGAHVAPQDTVIWLHDFFTLCMGVRLQRNDLAFCGAPEVTSNSCGICVYGEGRSDHLLRIKHLFGILTPTVMVPSAVTRDLWVARSTFAYKQIVIAPHLTLSWEKKPVASPRRDAVRIRLGFLGSAVRHKGWAVFGRLSHDPSLVERFDFIALTASNARHRGKKIRVNVSPDQPDAMTDAVAAQEIDLVLHWPEWPETFALTAYEALAGGAFLVTNAGSGNVAATVEETGRGVVLEDEDALAAFLAGPEAAALARRSRSDRAEFTVTSIASRLSLAVLERR